MSLTQSHFDIREGEAVTTARASVAIFGSCAVLQATSLLRTINR